MGRSMGTTPVWGRRSESDTWLCWLRVLESPLRLYELLFYSRADITTRKTRPAEWARLHSDWRYWDALFCYLGPPSHFLWNIKWALLGVMLSTALIGFYEFGRNQLGWPVPDLDRNNSIHSTFEMSIFALALMLALRVRRAYDRWWSARVGFGGVGGAALTLVNQAIIWVESAQLQADIRRWGVVWHYSIMQVCMNHADLHPKAAALLSEEELAVYRGSRKGRQLAFLKLRLLVAEAQRLGLSDEKAVAMDATIVKGQADASTCTRIVLQAMPHGFTLISTGFLLMCLLLMPLGLWKGLTWTLLAGMLVTALLLLSVDEVATQLENPFPLLPLEDILESTVRDTARAFKEAEALGALRRKQERCGSDVGIHVSGSSDCHHHVCDAP